MQVSMFRFAEFCVGHDADRAKIISKRKSEQRRQESKRQSGEPGGGGGEGYYAGLLSVLRKKHWGTNDIRQLDEAEFDNLNPNGRGYLARLRIYQDRKDKYVAKWKSRRC